MIAIIFGIFYLLLSDPVEAAGVDSLIVDIVGLRTSKGQLLVSIYDDPSTFPKTKGMLEQKFVDLQSGDSVRVSFYNLMAGKRYAIAVMHDEDYNGKMTKNIFRYPKEGYCFSRNIKPKFRPPNWEECSFVLNKDMVIAIEMIY